MSDILKRYLPKRDWMLLQRGVDTKKTLPDYEILGYEPFPVQLEWVKWAFDKKSRDKLFLGAREYGKSDMVILYGIYHELLKNNEATFLLMTRTFERAKYLTKTIGESLTMSGFKGDYSKTSITLEGRKTNRKQPNILAMTINGRTKGNHADYLIMDDPVDPLDEHLVAIKRRVKKVYQEASNIAKNVIIIGQYVSEDDLYIEIENKVDCKRAWHGTIPELDKDKEEFLKSRTEREWGLNYAGFIVASSEAPFRDILEVSSNPVGSVIAFIDPSHKGGDYTALSIGWMENGKLVVWGEVWKESGLKCLPKIIQKCQEFGVSDAYYESNGLGDAIYFASEEAILPINTTGNKEGRIARVEGLVINLKVVMEASSGATYKSQIVSWSPFRADFDDAPDSLASLVKIFGLI